MSSHGGGPAGLVDDLAAEQEQLDAVVANLDDSGWRRPTPAIGWDVRDQIAHLALVDQFAAVAATRPGKFMRIQEDAARDPLAFEAQLFASGHALRGMDALLLWRRERSAVRAALVARPRDQRLQWFGPSMSPASFLTARLMETWAHGQDVLDTLSLRRRATPRLRHVADLGVRTRGWSFAVRGLPPDPTPVRVELSGPDGEVWCWGEEAAADTVRGTAMDFCLVVTQRRHWRDTALEVQGAAAASWMHHAQAFAGPATHASRGRALPQGSPC
jgi:uncharacterized protein (TIGR03084 family)